MEADSEFEDMSVPSELECKEPRSDHRKDDPREHRHPTETCDLVKSVRKWRMKWIRVGHVLRKEDSFLARKMLMRMQKPYEEGSILQDAPQHDTIDM